MGVPAPRKFATYFANLICLKKLSATKIGTNAITIPLTALSISFLETGTSVFNVFNVFTKDQTETKNILIDLPGI